MREIDNEEAISMEMPSASEKKFWSDWDEQHREFMDSIAKHDAKFGGRLGWKDMFFSILKYQQRIHPDTGYNFHEAKQFTCTRKENKEKYS